MRKAWDDGDTRTLVVTESNCGEFLRSPVSDARAGRLLLSRSLPGPGATGLASVFALAQAEDVYIQHGKWCRDVLYNRVVFSIPPPDDPSRRGDRMFVR